MPELVSAHSPSWLGNRHQQLVSTNSKIITETASQVTLGFVCAHSPCWLGNRHRKQISRRLRNNQRDCLHRWSLDSSVHRVPDDSVIVTKNGVAEDSKIMNETDSRADAWIGQRTQSQMTPKSTPKTKSLSTRKSSPQLLPQLTLGFVCAPSPCCQGNRHRKLSS